MKKQTTNKHLNLTMKSKPGFPHKDVSWLFGLIAVRSPLTDIKALSAAKPKQKTRECSAFQTKDSDFSLLSWEKCEPKFSQWLSKKLKTTVAYLWDEDTSGWFGYSIFSNGVEREAFQFGDNYEGELGEFAEELGDSMPTPEKKKEGWDVFATKDGVDFQFRSKVTTVKETDLLKGLAFVDSRFKALGISIPKDFPKKQEVISVTLN